MSSILIRKKAKKISENKYFHATEGWLRKFLKRHPEMKEYLMNRPRNDRPSIRIAAGEARDKEGDDSDSSKGWIGIEDNQISRE